MKEYAVNIPWPVIDINDSSTWFQEMNYLEAWLEEHIGKHNVDWVYIRDPTNLVIGFSKPEYKTFFLVAYDK